MHIYLGAFWDRFLTPYLNANAGCQELRVRLVKASVICVAKDATPILHAESKIRKFVGPWDCSYEMFIVLSKSHAPATLERYPFPSKNSNAFSLLYLRACPQSF